MAEIRSTMDMVMERAARMAARAEDVPTDQADEERGMRLVAEFLAGKLTEQPVELLQQEDPSKQMAVRRGMAKGLVRNIVIPRDENLMAGSITAISTLLNLAGPDNEVNLVTSELKQILEQYSQHKAQLKQQLEDGMRAQMVQKLQEQGIDSDQLSTTDPTMLPQFREEWARAQSELNDQYSQALEQRKEMLQQRFA